MAGSDSTRYRRPQTDLLPQTPSQTVGPFFHFGLISPGGNVLYDEGVSGERIVILGTVRDGRGGPVVDAAVEIWQPDAAGIFAHPADRRSARADPAFRGFGRAATDKDGIYRFLTVKPGRTVDDAGRELPPQVNVHVFARGLLIHAFTRLYFADETGNEADPNYAQLPEERGPTLLATPAGEEDAARVYRFDIRLQGEGETVFFEP